MQNAHGRQFIGCSAAVLAIVSGAAIAVGPAGAMSPMTMPGVPAGAMQHMEKPTKAAWMPFAPALRPGRWSVTASSAAAAHPASAVLGKSRSGYWRSARLGRGAHLPQSLTIRFHSAQLVSGLTYVPHARDGEIGRFRIALSRDGARFGHAVAYGRWQANSSDKKVAWKPQLVRAVRLTALSLSPAGAHALAAKKIVLSGVHQHSSSMPMPMLMPMPMPHGARDAATATTAASGPSVIGQWGPTIGFPLVPVAAALIPGNRLVMWSADENMSFDGGVTSQTQTAILNLTTGAVSPSTVTDTGHNMFCPGVSLLPNGEVMVTGGVSNAQTSIYNPATNTWRAGPLMNIGRGYQAQTTLSDGQVFVLGGSWSGTTGGKLGELWSPTHDWRKLTGVPADPIYTADAEGVYRADNHGWFFATSGGKVFQAGPSKQMHWITTTGQGSITSAGARGTSGDEMNGNAVLYDVGKILAAGGAPSYQNSATTAAANTIDISGGGAKVTSSSAMHYGRGFANSVVLPTGKVFTVGGETVQVPFSDQNSDMSPEMWDPGTRGWTVMAAQPEPRNYHSVALLLPDGTVFSGGGGLCGSCATNHPDGQIFLPPYLFNTDGSRRIRPTISSAPAVASTGQKISVTTGGAVASFVLMRYDEATHTVDTDQRRIPLSINSSSGNTYQLTIPSDPGVALPGPYMLFAIDGNGTPSVSATISISGPATTPGSTYVKTVTSTGPAVYWPLNDASGSTSAADLSGNRDVGAISSSGVTYGAPSPVESASGQGLNLAGGQIVSTQPQRTPQAFTEELWFKTTTTTGGYLTRFGDSPTGADNDADRVLYLTNSGQLAFGTWTGVTNVVTSPSSYNDGKWHLAAASQGSDGMHLYVDGAQVASNTITGAQPFTGYWQIGGTSTDWWPNRPSGAFTGTISDASMYRSELTGDAVKAQYLASPASTTTTGGGGSSYGTTVTSAGPSAYWPLNDASGSTSAADLSGNGNVGSFSSSGITYGTPSPVESATGLGVTLTGGQIISHQAQPTPQAFTEELWFSTTTTTGGYLTRFGDSPTGANDDTDRILYMTNGGQLALGTWTGVANVITSPSSYNDGKWHFAVASQGSDGMHLYVDGAQVASSSVTGAQNYTGYWQVGGTATQWWPNRPSAAFTGSVSDAAMYRTELSVAQVQSQYAASPAHTG